MSDADRLRDLGWDAFFAEAFAPHAAAGLIPARVCVQHRAEYVVDTGTVAELRAALAGRLRGDHVIRIPGKLAYAGPLGARTPAVGDWVAIQPLPGEDRGVIQAVLPRRTEFSRKESLSTTREVLAANIDTVFVVAALIADDGEEAAQRLARRARSQGLAAYLAMAHESGARVVLLLTKADLCGDADLSASAFAGLGVDVILTSAVSGRGLDALGPYIAPGRTIALIGASGVGKSTLANALMAAEVLRTQEVRSDGEGRHTTVGRQLLRLPGGGMVIDTPGLRQLDVWDAKEGVGELEGVDELAGRCRFRDCRHEAEPGCAVQAAIADGTIEGSRLENARRLERELERLDRLQRQRSDTYQRRRQRALRKSAHFRDVAPE